MISASCCVSEAVSEELDDDDGDDGDGLVGEPRPPGAPKRDDAEVDDEDGEMEGIPGNSIELNGEDEEAGSGGLVMFMNGLLAGGCCCC